MSLKNLLVGHQVRRTGEPHGTVETGVIVKRFTAPYPDAAKKVSNEQFSRDVSMTRSAPAQVLVFWTGADLVPDRTEWLTEIDIDGDYPGGNTYRAWDREFPVFAVESGGYGDVSVLTPDGERAVYVYGHDLPGYDDAEPDDAFRLLVTTAVAQYLDKTVNNEEPAELANAEQSENAEFEGAADVEHVEL